MGVSVFQHPAFVWACAAFAAACLVAAVAVGARAFWAELAAKFLRMPAAGKAALVAFVAVATAVAQKPGSVSTDSTDSHGLGEAVLSTDYTNLHGLGTVVLDRIDKIDRIEETETVSAETSGTLSNPVNPVHPVKDNLRVSATPCEKSVTDDDITRGYRLVEVRTNETVSYELPTNGTVVGTWHLTDAYEAVVRVWLEEGRRKKEEGRSAELSSSFLPAQHDKDASATTLLPSSFFPFPSQQDASATTLLPSSLFLFPLGHHVVTSLWAHVWGWARPQLKNASNELVAVGAPMFAQHGVSRLWTAATANGTVLLTWEDFFLGNPYERLATNLHESTRTETDESSAVSGISPKEIREDSCQFVANPTISAQLELIPSGDFIARSNAVERVYRRVNPDDWDDDGIPNDEDDDPRIAADETQFGPHQTLPEDANTNAYCWVDLVVPQANALVTFAGAGASNLADPSFVAKAGEVNRVTLLIGKTYRVTCPQPFRIAAKSSEEIKEDWKGANEVTLHWPVSVSSTVTEKDDSSAAQRAEVRQASSVGVNSLALSPLALLAATTTATLPVTRSHTFVMSVVPSGLGGLFGWTTHCCSISGTAYSFEQTCRDGCACSGCSTEGFFEYEGYQLRVYGPACPCSGSPADIYAGDDDPPSRGVSVYFTKSVIFLEDEYENAPGETVPWQSTETKLVCSVAGGLFGGRVKIEIEGADNLIQYTGPTLPFEQSLAAGEDLSFEIRYRAVKESGAADDIKVTATFTENETEWEQECLDTATAVRVELETVSLVPENRTRHIFGVGERVYCRTTPDLPCKWTVSAPAEAGESFDVVVLQCPIVSSALDLTVMSGGCSYTLDTRIVEPAAIVCQDAVALDFGLSAGHAGGIGLRLDLYVSPDSVSFSGLALQEIPANGTHDGYFSSLVFTNIWNHTKDRKAGVWKAISPDNFYMTDDACLGDEMPQLHSDGSVDAGEACGWSDGRIVWPIPMGWQGRDACDTDSFEIKRMDQSYAQTFRIDSAGTVSVEKHGFQAVRGTNAVIRLLKRMENEQ